MKRILLLLFLCFIFAFPLFTGSSAIAEKQILNGDTNQKDTIIDAPYNPEDFTGSYAVVAFVSFYCQDCFKTVSELSDLHKKFDDSVIRVAGIYVDTIINVNDLIKFKRDKKISYPFFIHNEGVFKRYNVIFIPTVLFFDKTGKVVKKFIGHRREKVLEKEFIEMKHVNQISALAVSATKEYYPDGTLKSECYKGRQEGTCIYHYATGAVQSEVRYRDGELAIKNYHLDGTLYLQEHYNNGKLISQKYYNKKGKPIEEGTITLYYENGKLMEEENIKGGRLNGVNRLYYPDGSLKGEHSHREGILDGISKDYHKNGRLAAVRYYHDGRKEGVSKIYYDSGKLFLEENYKDGKLDGMSREYDKSGMLVAEWNYKAGQREGKLEIQGAQKPTK